ncbi:MAG TPA: GNAT family N-acetyltransferase [Xanthobacteraceae bacterium]|nr:GNAT family N-acetyltransferase [Xanthobacteraceae bacterium]
MNDNFPGGGAALPSLPHTGDTVLPVPPGKIASVVTHLEMRARPAPLREKPEAGLALRRVQKPDLAWYRALFRRVGEDWLWFSRLAMDDARLAAIVHHPAVEIYALRRGGRDEGLLELDFRFDPDVELAFFGVAPGLIGSGAGRYLINRANDLVWPRAPRRFTVHTCTHDHPAALPFYLRAGFVAVGRDLEMVDDPRLSGLLARSAAPGVPVIAL